jgi:hypothetical protein
LYEFKVDTDGDAVEDITFRSHLDRIEAIRGAGGRTIRLIGQLDAEYLPELKDQIEANGHVAVLEMDEVTLVDVDVVRFLIDCKVQGIELCGCLVYIREWIARERESAKRDRRHLCGPRWRNVVARNIR